jgi:hypothetical protein
MWRKTVTGPGCVYCHTVTMQLMKPGEAIGPHSRARRSVRVSSAADWDSVRPGRTGTVTGCGGVVCVHGDQMDSSMD